MRIAIYGVGAVGGYHQGRPSELEAQNGAVLRLGFEKNVHTPVNAFVYYCLLPMERRARTEVKVSP